MTKSTYVSSLEQSANVRKIVEEALENEALTNVEVISVLHSLLDVTESDQEHIIRGMELPSTYRIAGLQLLAFFSRLVELHYPAIKMKCITEQEGERVKFILEVDAEHRHKIESLLEHYSLVLLKEAPIDSVAKNDKQLMELKKVLDLSALEISLSKGIEASHLEGVSDEMESFAEEVEHLHTLVGRGLGAMQELQNIMASLLSTEQESISKALKILRERLHVNMTEEDEQEVKAALLAVKEHAPDSFEEIRQLINKSSASGAAGDTLYSWVASLSTLMPK